MLSIEQNCIITVIKDHLAGENSTLPDGLDADLLEKAVNIQQCAGIFYYQTKHPSLQGAFARNSYNNVNINSIIAKIHSAFTEANIPYLIFKGVEIAKYYPQPSLRSMGDIDILVHDEDKKKADEVLISLGFAIDTSRRHIRPENHEWVYLKGSFMVELHERMMYDGTTTGDKIAAFTDRAWEFAEQVDGVRFALRPEFHFVFALLHLRKHLLWAGVGLRQFTDVAVMCKFAPLDWETVEKMLESLEILPFARVCFAMIERWFSITCPIGCAEIDEDFYIRSTETIMNGGVFGFHNQTDGSMHNNGIINAVRGSKKPWLTKLKLMLAVLFPPLDRMKDKFPKMSKIRPFGVPILLPLMWIIRDIKSIFGGTATAGLSAAAIPMTIEDEIVRRNDVLEKWRL